ncbi:hypothetical protein E4N62_18670 [Streptomyces sp. MNU76]|uniref:hypothetical protein n=1 Tax=Streptomyces sp. MNU76 TaxID=2560026 RepID=UPI001E3D0761|nr:hypothetical protein [Streptomyces sp. MNU76]MCC9707116.1 hypothetical protein [Streptomyces sp. MNU76]
MTPTRDALADLLTEAAQQVGSVLTAQGPAVGTSARPYLAPFLGPLAAATPVLHSLSEQLDAYFSDPLPKTPAGLFTLACLAAANGQLNEATAEFISAVEAVCDRAGISPGPSAQPPATTDTDSAVGTGIAFTNPEWEAIQKAARIGGLDAGEFVAVSASAVAASLLFTDLCREIFEGLLADAEYVRTGPDTDAALGTDVENLPTIVQHLLDAPGAAA